MSVGSPARGKAKKAGQAVTSSNALSDIARSQMKISLAKIFDGIDGLREACGNQRNFTIDGRLVGDLGEIVAAQEFAIILDDRQRADHDTKTEDGRNVHDCHRQRVST